MGRHANIWGRNVAFTEKVYSLIINRHIKGCCTCTITSFIAVFTPGFIAWIVNCFEFHTNDIWNKSFVNICTNLCWKLKLHPTQLRVAPYFHTSTDSIAYPPKCFILYFETWHQTCWSTIIILLVFLVSWFPRHFHNVSFRLCVIVTFLLHIFRLIDCLQSLNF